MPDPKERSAAAMKSLGIAEEFAPYHFRIVDNGERLECPACLTYNIMQWVRLIWRKPAMA